MKSFLFIFFVATAIIIPGFSFGVTFDIWETRQSINEVVSLSRQHDIPIARDGIIHGYKNFDSKLIDENFYKASTLYYRTNLTGQSSIVYLRLTDDPKFVREIEVKLFGITDKELFTKEMLGILSQKYGPYKVGMETVFRFYQWRPDKDSQVRVRVFGAEASVTYTDLEMKERFENQRREKERKSIKKDSDKF